MDGRSQEDREATRLTQALVRIDSSDPGAYEGEIERFVKSWLEERIDKIAGSLRQEISIEEIEPLPNRRCLRLHIPGETDAPALVLLSHLDTVTLGEGWDDEAPALGGTISGGRLYGRGACDMKGGLASAMLAMEDALAHISSTQSLPRRPLDFVCTCDEEDFMRGSEAAIKAGWLDGSQWVLDTEPTDGMVRQAHKGRVWFKLRFKGITAHASTPQEGADAICAAAFAIAHIRKTVDSLPEDLELGATTVTFGQIEGGYRPYVVPDACTVWIDMRLAPPATPDLARRIVEDAIAEAEDAIFGTHGSYQVTGDRPAIPSSPHAPLLAALEDATEKATGTPAETAVFTGYTDSAVVASLCHNPNCASYGPGSLKMAHKPNEYVPLADLARVHAVFRELLLSQGWPL